MNTFSVTILESSKELTPKEKIMLKDTSNAIKLDEACNDGSLVINPVAYVILSIHNPKSDNPDYENYLILADDGKKYVTGSTSFWNAFTAIWEEMADAGEYYPIEIFKRDSKNYKGKQFISCAVC